MFRVAAFGDRWCQVGIVERAGFDAHSLGITDPFRFRSGKLFVPHLSLTCVILFVPVEESESRIGGANPLTRRQRGHTLSADSLQGVHVMRNAAAVTKGS